MIKLTEILDEIIAAGVKPLRTSRLHELFDFENAKLPKIQKLGDYAFNFEIEIGGDMVDVYVDFITTPREDLKLSPRQENSKSIYNVVFALGDEMNTNQKAKTDLKTIGFIMFVVTECVKMFVDSKNPDLLVFFATSKDFTERGERQKLTMYKEIAKKHIPSGYSLDNIHSADGKVGFFIFNIKVK